MKFTNQKATTPEQNNNNNPPSQNPQIYGTLGSKYILIEKIGKGISSHVFLAKKTFNSAFSSDDLLAIKICKRSYNQKLFNEEGIILKKLPSNPFIIKIYESGKALLTKKKSSKTRTTSYHVLEYLENGVLFDYIHFKNNISKGFGEKLGRIIFFQLLLAVEFCHKNYIAHKDIKIENVLLNSQFQVKLADFGFATEEFLNQNNKPKFTVFGTSGYFPPEVYNGSSSKLLNSFQYDIFALGVCLFYIVCGFQPFATSKRNDINYKKIVRRNYEGFWSDHQNKTGELSRSFKDLVNNLLAANLEERYNNIDQIKNDPWIKEGGFDNEIEFNKCKDVLVSEFENRKKFMFS